MEKKIYCIIVPSLLSAVLIYVFNSSHESVPDTDSDSDSDSEYSLTLRSYNNLIVLICLLFAVSTPFLFHDSVVRAPTDASKSSPETGGDSDFCLSNQKQKLNSDDIHETNTIDPMPRRKFPRLPPMMNLFDKISVNPLRFGRYLCGKLD